MYHCDTFDRSLPCSRLEKLKGRQGRLRRMLMAGRALDCGRGGRVLRTATSGDWGGSWLRQRAFSSARIPATLGHLCHLWGRANGEIFAYM